MPGKKYFAGPCLLFSTSHNISVGIKKDFKNKKLDLHKHKLSAKYSKCKLQLNNQETTI